MWKMATSWMASGGVTRPPVSVEEEPAPEPDVARWLAEAHEADVEAGEAAELREGQAGAFATRKTCRHVASGPPRLTGRPEFDALWPTFRAHVRRAQPTKTIPDVRFAQFEGGLRTTAWFQTRDEAAVLEWVEAWRDVGGPLLLSLMCAKDTRSWSKSIFDVRAAGLQGEVACLTQCLVALTHDAVAWETPGRLRQPTPWKEAVLEAITQLNTGAARLDARVEAERARQEAILEFI